MARSVRCAVGALRWVAWAALLLGLGTATAAPLDRRGKTAGDETPQSSEFRAGAQAQLQSDWAGAKAHFEAALKIAPDYVPALIGMAAVAQAEGRLPDTERYLGQAERVAPGAWEVHLAWGRYHVARNAPDPAEKALRKAHELMPKAVPPMLELADLLMRKGRNADALAFYRKAVALDPKSKFAVYGLGVAAAATGQRAESLAAFEQAAQLAPRDPAPLRAMGRLYLEAGELDKALAEFDRALARQPKFFPLMLDRSEVLSRQQRWPEAIDQVLAAERLSPQSPEVQLKLADTYQGAGRWNDAETRYLKTIELVPKSPFAYNNLAWMTVARGGDARKAIGWAQQAVALSPRSSPFHDTLGWAHRAAGDLNNALASVQQAIKLEPNVAGYHYHLGQVQADLKNKTAARASLQKALQLDPKSPQADEIRKLLTSLAAA